MQLRRPNIVVQTETVTSVDRSECEKRNANQQVSGEEVAARQRGVPVAVEGHHEVERDERVGPSVDEQHDGREYGLPALSRRTFLG